jgi:glycosyltransferase involved in cell wall biosynthesis
MLKISVIIPVKNDEHRIGNCLSALFNQKLPPFEVIVVDGHSTDQTVSVAQKYPVKLFYEEYGTVGGARQIGVENATGEYIAFTDSDCIPESNWLEMLLKGFDSGVVGVGGGIKNIGDGVWEKSIALALNSFLGSANSVQDRMFSERKFVRSISGCNCCYRKSDILKAGGFNVTYRFNEDTDLNRRIRAFGSLLYIPEAVVLHDQARDLKQFAKRMFLFGEGRAKSRIMDLQIFPPILLLFIIPSLVFFPMIFYALVLVYAIIVLSFSLFITFKGEKFYYFLTLPVIFVLEHSMYSLGFWQGIFTGLAKVKL